MKCIIFTQDERIYLPTAIEIVVRNLIDDIECIILSPPMSTHGGILAGLKKHIPVFGIKGSFYMGMMAILSKLGPLLRIKPIWSNFWSIEAIAKYFEIPVYKIADVNSEEMHSILDEKKADLLISVSCPQVLEKTVLAKFKYGGINVHSAPLPKYRGLMPGFWVLYNGEKQTAVTVHLLDDKLDNGDILLQEPVEISPTETWNTLILKTKRTAGYILVKAVKKIKDGSVSYIPNRDDDATYYTFPTWREARDFRKRGGRIF